MNEETKWKHLGFWIALELLIFTCTKRIRCQDQSISFHISVTSEIVKKDAWCFASASVNASLVLVTFSDQLLFP